MGRSTDQLSRTWGLTGDEAQQATEGSARNLVTILQSSAVLTQAMQGISLEYFEFVRRHVENSMKCMNELWLCRTPQDLAAVQTDFVRDTMKAVLDVSRRMADRSLKLTDGAANHIAQNMRRPA
jgi:hypothetical protein